MRDLLMLVGAGIDGVSEQPLFCSWTVLIIGLEQYRFYANDPLCDPVDFLLANRTQLTGSRAISNTCGGNIS